MEKVKGFIRSQFVDNSNVVPYQTWNDRDSCFYLNSPAGLIIYRPKSVKDTSRFRDRWINKFIHARNFFTLYREIIRNEKVKYRANLHTRLKLLLSIFR